MFRKVIFICLVTLSHSNFLAAQKATMQIEWDIPSTITDTRNGTSFEVFRVKNGYLNQEKNFLPSYSQLIPIANNVSSAELSIVNFKTEKLIQQEKKIIIDVTSFSETPVLNYTINIIKHNKYININLIPLVNLNGEIHKIIEITVKATPNSSLKRLQKTTTDVSPINFKAGDWHKFAVTSSGPCKISYNDLKTSGILASPVSSNTINIYGGPGKMIPFVSSEDRPGTLGKINITVRDGGDGSFGTGDYLLFFAEHGGNTYLETSTNLFVNEVNSYSDTNFVFLRLNDDTPARIATVSNSQVTASSFQSADFMYHHEKEWLNLIKSGRMWVGEDFQEENPRVFNTISNHDTSTNITINITACARSRTYTNNTITVFANDDSIGIMQFAIVSQISHNDFVKFSQNQFTFKSIEKNIEIKLKYNRPEAGAQAWLDKFSINYHKKLELQSDPLYIQNKSAILNPENYEYTFSSPLSDILAWDISNYSDLSEIDITSNNTLHSITANSSTTKSILVFSESSAKEIPFVKGIEFQNLNYTITPEYVIVSPKILLPQAQELADFHYKKSNLKTLVVDAEHIYNMHSSGRKEAGAIRDYIKYLYDNPQGTDSLKYVLLFGSGSYDPKNRISNNVDLIPTYQSLNSIKQTSSYVTDDFYGVLDDNEGDFLNNDQLDVSVGRIPARSIADAQRAIDKIFQYHGVFASKKDDGSSYTHRGSWQNNIVFVADDKDINEHMRQAEELAQIVTDSLGNFNVSKVYMDSYVKENNASGSVFPGAEEEISRRIEEGALIVNYTGHGGEHGWASERVLDINSIEKLENRDRLPLVMTATCEFSRFDDPTITSAGEHLFLRKNGGAIALFTTVRLVFSIPNFNLNKHLFNVLSQQKESSSIRIGDLFRQTKINNNAGTNDRNFTLLGDPALELALPKNNILVDSIILTNNSKPDTLSALSQGTLYGKVSRNGVIQSAFNGTAEIKLYDQKSLSKTLGNDGDPFEYQKLNSLIFKSKVSVKNGYFSSEIILPKNTISSYGQGRISVFASENNQDDAAGFSKDYVFGGLNNLATSDDIGPEIKLYLNDTSFVFGGRVTKEPYLIAKLSDESGINVSSLNIENNLTATVDKSNEFQYQLGTYYQTDLNTYKTGQVNYQLKGIKNGTHSLEMSASDNHNNKNSTYTEFIIEDNEELALDHVLNYPNPFTSNTGFYFEQNHLQSNLQILIQIFTISGKLVKSITTSAVASQKRIGPINWDGKDDYGDNIGRGVYLYKVKVIASDGTTAQEIQKLVILK